MGNPRAFQNAKEEDWKSPAVPRVQCSGRRSQTPVATFNHDTNVYNFWSFLQLNE